LRVLLIVNGNSVLLGIGLVQSDVLVASLLDLMQIMVQVQGLAAGHLHKAARNVGAMVGNALKIGKQVGEYKPELDAAKALTEADGVVQLLSPRKSETRVTVSLLNGNMKLM